MRVTRGEGELVRLRRDEPSATMRALQISRGFEHGEVTPDCGNGRTDVLGEVLKRRKFNLLKVDFQPVFPLVCRHCGNRLVDIGINCKIFVDLASESLK